MDEPFLAIKFSHRHRYAQPAFDLDQRLARWPADAGESPGVMFAQNQSGSATSGETAPTIMRIASKGST